MTRSLRAPLIRFTACAAFAMAAAVAGARLIFPAVEPPTLDIALLHILSDRQITHFTAGPKPPEIRVEFSPFLLRDFPVAAQLPSCPDATSTLCAWAQFDKDHIAGSPGNYDGAAPWAQAHYSYMRDTQPPAAFIARENEILQHAVTAIAADPFLRANFDKVKQQTLYKNKDEAAQQAQLKQDILQRMATIVRAAYGLPPVEVLLYSYPADRSLGIIAHYDPLIHRIAVNYDAFHGTTDSFAHMIQTIMEETRHSIDHDYALQMIKGTMAPGDPRTEHTAAIVLNSKDYISTYKDALYRENGWEDSAYERQYIERTAKAFAATAAARIILAFYPQAANAPAAAAIDQSLPRPGH